MKIGRVEVKEVDNRDFRTTWLWIDDDHYIEVDPLELLENAIDNITLEGSALYRDALTKLKNL